MKFLIVLLLIGAAIAVNTKAVHHGDKAHKLHKAWAEHKAKHHPKLDSPEEENQLKARFAKTDEMIHKHNSDPNVKHHIDHNHFSTMTNEEKRIYLFGVRPHHPSGQSVNKLGKVWAQHKAKYHPEMESPEEETVRKSYFAKAHEVIQKHNNDPEATHRWGQLAHNHFSAMTNDEKKKHFFGVKPAKSEVSEHSDESNQPEDASDDDDALSVRRVQAIVPGHNYHPNLPVTQRTPACNERPHAGGPVKCLKQIPRLG